MRCLYTIFTHRHKEKNSDASRENIKRSLLRKIGNSGPPCSVAAMSSQSTTRRAIPQDVSGGSNASTLLASVASMRTTSSSTRCRALTTASTAKARPGMLIAGMVWMTHWPVATMVVMATGTMVVMATEVGETSVCARVRLRRCSH